MKKFNLLILLLIAGTPLLFDSCERNPDDPTINIFSVEDDMALGLQVKNEILSDPATYPLLDTVQYAASYNYLRGIVDKILSGGSVYYKDKFAWETYIIHDDEVLNAFCTPGGYMFVYTGLIKYLEAEHELAGVMGHEIAHADRRHSTDAMTRDYGISVLISVALGENAGQLTTIAANLAKLKFNRSMETEADEYSVKYLCPTDYKADGASAFFQKLIDNGEGQGDLDWFSTHPSPEKRVEKIQETRNSLGCSGDEDYDVEYAAFKNGLP